jgi:hypothetical protein
MESTMIRRGGLSVAAACVLLACAAATAQAAVTTNEWTPVDVITANPCNGEAVEVTGMGHALMTYSQDASGGYSLTVHADFADVTGIGSLGNSYLMPTAVEASTDTNGATTATIAGQVSLISQGSAPNFEGHLIMHITFNANGVPTATVTNITPTGCTG